MPYQVLSVLTTRRMRRSSACFVWSKYDLDINFTTVDVQWGPTLPLGTPMNSILLAPRVETLYEEMQSLYRGNCLISHIILLHISP